MGAVVLIYDRTKSEVGADRSATERPVDRRSFCDADTAARWLRERGFNWQGNQWDGPKRKVAELVAWREFPAVESREQAASPARQVIVMLYMRITEEAEPGAFNMKTERHEFPNADAASAWLTSQQFTWLGDLWHRQAEVAEILAC